MNDFFKCTITYESFQDPVIINCGHTFEKKAIMEWKTRTNTCPICRETIDILIPNRILYQMIQTDSTHEIQKDSYNGGFKNGHPHGKGVFVNSKGDRYEGIFTDTILHGTCFYVDGTSYEGYFHDNGHPFGEGVFVDINGDRYQGVFSDPDIEQYTKDDKIVLLLHSGKCHYADGNIYEGEFQNNIPHGKGVWKDIYKRRYEGIFAQGEIVEGTQYNRYGGGGYYIGQFKDFKAHGKGIYYNPFGNIIYEGGYKNDVRDGFGIQYSFLGKRISYEGEFKLSLPHGQGTYYYKCGGRFVGTFYRGTQKYGIRYYVNGTRYEGEFKYLSGNGYIESQIYVMHGKGAIYGSEGILLYKGDFDHGIIHGKGHVYYSDGSHYEGDLKKGRRHGYGRHVYNNGVIYEGMFQHNRRHKGTLFLNNGTTQLNWECRYQESSKKNSTKGVYFDTKYELWCEGEYSTFTDECQNDIYIYK